MNRTAKTGIFTLCALLAAAAGIYWRAETHRSAAAEEAAHLFFSQTLSDASGAPHRLADYRGEVVVVNFWATWCAPCIEEIPEFSRLQAEYADRNVKFIGIGIDTPENVAEFEKKARPSYPLLVNTDAGTELARRFGNDAGALPFTLLIGRQGRVNASKLGRLHEKELREWLSRAVER